MRTTARPRSRWPAPSVRPARLLVKFFNPTTIVGPAPARDRRDKACANPSMRWIHKAPRSARPGRREMVQPALQLRDSDDVQSTASAAAGIRPPGSASRSTIDSPRQMYSRVRLRRWPPQCRGSDGDRGRDAVAPMMAGRASGSSTMAGSLALRHAHRGRGLEHRLGPRYCTPVVSRPNDGVAAHTGSAPPRPRAARRSPMNGSVEQQANSARLGIVARCWPRPAIGLPILSRRSQNSK